jgi:integrase
MRPNRVPSYRCFKPKNLGLVVLNGTQHYLGPYGTPESMAEYNRLIQEHLASSPTVVEAKAAPQGATVGEMIVAFWEHAEKHYRHPDGTPSGELVNLRAALKPLRRLYSHTPAREFGPVGLRAVRDDMVKSGLSRTTVNARINRLRRVFKWAASVELIPPGVSQALATVAGLQRGRTQARESKAVGPVAVERVEATLPFLSRPIAAMVRLQLLSGMRPGEACAMRGRDLIPGEPTWTYRPESHKSAWRGRDRAILLGPQAQAVVTEFLGSDRDAYLFRPEDAVAEHHARRGSARKSKPTPSERSKRATKPGAKHARRYQRNSYRNAIARACDRAFPHPTLAAIKPKGLTEEQRAELEGWRRVNRWHPNQLRHAAATLIRARYGLEAAQAILGHAKADVTQVYAERDLAKAHAIMAEIG